MIRLIRRAQAVSVASVLAVAASAGAQDGLTGRLPGNDATLRDTPGVDSALSPLPAARDATDGDLGEHQVTGTVRELDAGAGTMVVDVKGKDVRVLFPGSALSRLERGDEVTLTVAVHRNDRAAERPPATAAD